MEKHLARINRNLKVTNLGLLIVVIGLAVLNLQYLTNLVIGPKRMDRRTLFKLQSTSGLWNDYIKVDGTNALETGMEEVYMKQKYGRTVEESVTARYYLITDENKALLIKIPTGTRDLTVLTGRLVNMPHFEEQQILPQMYGQEPELRTRLLPVMLDASDYRSSGLIGLAIGIALLGLAVWNLKKVADRKRNPACHPALRALEPFGFPQVVATEIDADVRANLPAPAANKIAATPSWLLHPTTYGLQVIAMRDIVWAYKHVTTHYTYFIPTGKTFCLMIADRHGRLLTISTSSNEYETDGLLGYISNVVPWALFGHSEELARAWRSDQASVIRNVDWRRAQFEENASLAVASNQ